MSGSLTRRMALTVAVWTALPLLVVGVYNHTATRRQLRSSCKAQNGQAARGTAAQLDLYLDNLLTGVRTVAQVPSLSDFLLTGSPQARADTLAALLGLRSAAGYETVYLTDPLGTVVLCTDAALPGRSYLAARWFRTAAAGQEMADEFRYDPEAGAVYLHFSAPVRAAGKPFGIRGVLVGRVTTSPIDRMIAADSNYAGRGEFGALWDDNGIRLSQGGAPQMRFRPLDRIPADVRDVLTFERRFGPDTARLLEAEPPARDVAGKSRLLLYNAKSDPYLDYESPHLGRGVAAMAPLRSKRWVYGIFTPEAGVYADLGGQTSRAAWLTLLACLAGMASGALQARRLLRPIQAVADAARALAAGDMERRAGEAGPGEVGELARTFDEMADTIARRTAELDRAREREQAEETRRMAEERYRSLIENAAYGICRINEGGGFIAANPAMASMLGYAHARELTQADSPPVWADEADRARLWKECHQAGEVEGFECAWRRRDGSTILVRLSGRITPGAPAGGTLDLIAENITGRKRAEEALRRSEAILAQAGQMARLGAWYVDFSQWEDLEGNPLSWSAETYRIFGYEPGSVAVSNELFFRHVHPEDRQRVRQEMADAISRRQAYQVEHRIVRADGGERHVLEHAEIAFDGQGRPLRITGALQDITERKRAEEQIHRLNAELEQRVRERTAQLEAANKELEAFSYSVSHDLRAPLRAINGFSQILIKDYAPELPAEARAHLERVWQGGLHLGHLIDDLLAFSRLGRQSLNRKPVRVDEIVRLALDDLRAEQEGREIEFVLGELPGCQADPSLLRQVFVNLLSNAIKYTRPREKARIEVGRLQAGTGELHGADTGPVFYVRDNGIGFNMRYADTLFGVFQRLHSRQEFEGTGVGLAIVQRIVARHGGRIWAEAEVDMGATFYFTLEGSSSGEAQEPRAAAGIPDGSRMVGV